MAEKGMRTQTGKVVSNSGDKSIKVTIDYKVQHPKYGKYVRRRSKLSVHDEGNEANLGDMVVISASRPRSKTKSWRLVKVLEKAVQK